MNYRNKVKIKFKGDPNTYQGNFEDTYETEYYLVIDKQITGENIAKEILDNFSKKDIINIDDEYAEIEDRYTKEIQNTIYAKISAITDNIYQDIENFVYEYLDYNICDKED